MIGSTILALILVALWVAAWLHWFFDGHLRNFLFAHIFPEDWRGGRSKADVMTLPKDSFEMFLGAESMAPGFIRGVLGCPGCFSTYVAAAGTLLSFFALLLPSCGLWGAIFISPLVWAPAAWVGHRLHNYL